MQEGCAEQVMSVREWENVGMVPENMEERGRWSGRARRGVQKHGVAI